MGSRIDIREEDQSEISEITFADGCLIERDGKFIRIEDEAGDRAIIYISDVDNLIKALEKAKQLGWY